MFFTSSKFQIWPSPSARQIASLAALALICVFGHLANAANTENDLIATNSAANLLVGSNWSLGHVPIISEDATYTGTTTGTRRINAGSLTVGSFNITGNSGTFSIRDEAASSTNSTLTLGGSGNLGNSVSGNSSDLIYVATGATFNLRGDNPNGFGRLRVVLGQNGNFNATGTLTISSIISDGGNGFGFTKTGPGMLTLSGANTYTGPTVIDAGSIQGSVASALGATSSVTINSGGTVQLSGSNAATDRINNLAGVIVNGGGTLNTGGLSEGVRPSSPTASNGVAGIGALTLQNTNSLLHAAFDFGAGSLGSTLAASSIIGGIGAYIDIKNWTGLGAIDNGNSGNDRLLFATNPGLTAAQLANYAFYDDTGGIIATGGQIITYGNMFEIVPISEPATWVIGGVLCAVLLFTHRPRPHRSDSNVSRSWKRFSLIFSPLRRVANPRQARKSSQGTMLTSERTIMSVFMISADVLHVPESDIFEVATWASLSGIILIAGFKFWRHLPKRRGRGSGRAWITF